MSNVYEHHAHVTNEKRIWRMELSFGVCIYQNGYWIVVFVLNESLETSDGYEMDLKNIIGSQYNIICFNLMTNAFHSIFKWG